jgi:polar amino acid transport system substrate-binding protein
VDGRLIKLMGTSRVSYNDIVVFKPFKGICVRRFIKQCIAAVSVYLVALSGAHAADLPVLKVGATAEAMPFNFLDPQTDTLQGVMIDIAVAVGKEIGFKPEMVSMPFLALMPSLTAQRIDIVASAFARTPARQELVDFTDVVFTYYEGLVVAAKDQSNYVTLFDLNGKTIGVQIGTTYAQAMEDHKGVTVRRYETMADMVRDIELGRLDAALGDGPTMAYQVAQDTLRAVRYVNNYEGAIPTPIGLAVRRGNAECLAKLNAALTKLRDSGELADIFKKWNVNVS